MGGVFSFLSGTVFRMGLGWLFDFLNKKQEHEQEIALQKLQGNLEAERHVRDMDRIRLQADLKVTEVKVMAEADEMRTMASAFVEAVKGTSVKTGIAWVDAWNACIRPAGATLALVLWGLSTFEPSLIILEGLALELTCAFLGVFVGDRIHAKSK